MISGGFLLSGGSKKIPPGGCIGDLGQSLRMFHLYILCFGVHPIDVPGHIILYGGGKPSCSPRQFQGKVFWGILCWAALSHFSTEENNLSKK